MTINMPKIITMTRWWWWAALARSTPWWSWCSARTTGTPCPPCPSPGCRWGQWRRRWQVGTLYSTLYEHCLWIIEPKTRRMFKIFPPKIKLIKKSQHGCTAVTLNGRPGVVVSGGVDGNQFNTTRFQEVAIIIARPIFDRILSNSSLQRWILWYEHTPVDKSARTQQVGINNIVGACFSRKCRCQKISHKYEKVRHKFYQMHFSCSYSIIFFAGEEEVTQWRQSRESSPSWAAPPR